MPLTLRALPLVKLVLAGLFALLLLLMVMGIPGQFAHMADEDPDLAYLRWPLTLFFELELLCVQWVDVILAAMGVAWTAFLGMTLYLMTKADEPGTPLLLIVLLGVGAAVCLLVLVLRALLQRATTLRTEMEAVI